jgi:DnaJ-class molecular chaperone
MEATSGQGGKGDTPRPINKERYDRNYLRIYGKICPACNGIGKVQFNHSSCRDMIICNYCGGVGYVEDK